MNNRTFLGILGSIGPALRRSNRRINQIHRQLAQALDIARSQKRHCLALLAAAKHRQGILFFFLIKLHPGNKAGNLAVSSSLSTIFNIGSFLIGNQNLFVLDDGITAVDALRLSAVDDV